LRLRDVPDDAAAIATLIEVVAKLPSEGSRLAANANIQIGFMHARRGAHLESEPFFRAATRAAPEMELASLNLFHALVHLGRRREALKEVVRLVNLVDSPAYRELLSEGFGADLPVTEEHIADHARALLNRYIMKSSDST
jgi:hypothetical protein